MTKMPRVRVITVGFCLGLAACGGSINETSQSGSSSGSGGGTSASSSAESGSQAASSSASGSASDCALTAGTTPTDVMNSNGCHVLTRDTSACKADREAQGLSGYWLEFSCRVTLSLTMQGGSQVIKAASDGQPDYESNYFPAGNTCHEDYPGGIQNPNQILPKNYVLEFPTAADMTATPMKGGVVGMAVNGVPIFGNFAAPGDDIFNEAKTFDRCGGHPQMMGAYHYHAEPYAISYDDFNFIGVLRDGYPVYGRKDSDGTYPTLDAYGGHMGVTADSPNKAIYHYHVNEQTSQNPQTMGQKQWFLTVNTYRGTPAACGTCM